MKRLLAVFFPVLTIALALPALVFSQGARAADADAVAAITKLESDTSKANLAGDVAFFEKILANDFTGGTSRGTWDTKASTIADMKDTKNNKMNSDTISDLKVRVHGDVAIATYKDTYDATIKGQHYARTVITTDVFERRNGTWIAVAGHSSQAAK